MTLMFSITQNFLRQNEGTRILVRHLEASPSNFGFVGCRGDLIKESSRNEWMKGASVPESWKRNIEINQVKVIQFYLCILRQLRVLNVLSSHLIPHPSLSCYQETNVPTHIHNLRYACLATLIYQLGTLDASTTWACFLALKHHKLYSGDLDSKPQKLILQTSNSWVSHKVHTVWIERALWDLEMSELYGSPMKAFWLSIW